MATKKKSSGRKTTTASPDKKKIGGKIYTKKACSTTKGNAQKMAVAERAAGKLARVVTTGKTHCVFVRNA